MSQRLVDAEEIEALLGVDRSTVYRMAGDGRLPAVKVGRQWRFPVDAVEERFQLDEAAPGAAGRPMAAPHPGLARAVVEPLLDVVAGALGVMMVLTDMRGQPMTAVVNPCPWFAARSVEPAVLEACTTEWREFAGGLDFTPRFRLSQFGFECARAFVRADAELVGMVLAGGIAPGRDDDPDGLYELDDAGRERVLESLPQIAAALSRLAGHTADVDASPTSPAAVPPIAPPAHDERGKERTR